MLYYVNNSKNANVVDMIVMKSVPQDVPKKDFSEISEEDLDALISTKLKADDYQAKYFKYQVEDFLNISEIEYVQIYDCKKSIWIFQFGEFTVPFNGPGKAEFRHHVRPVKIDLYDKDGHPRNTYFKTEAIQKYLDDLGRNMAMQACSQMFEFTQDFVFTENEKMWIFRIAFDEIDDGQIYLKCEWVLNENQFDNSYNHSLSVNISNEMLYYMLGDQSISIKYLLNLKQVRFMI